MTRVLIDPNVRVRDNMTYAGLEDVEGPLELHAEVDVYEPESGLVGRAHVEEIDNERRLVFLKVTWKTLSVPHGHIPTDSLPSV